MDTATVLDSPGFQATIDPAPVEVVKSEEVSELVEFAHALATQQTITESLAIDSTRVLQNQTVLEAYFDARNKQAVYTLATESIQERLRSLIKSLLTKCIDLIRRTLKWLAALFKGRRNTTQETLKKTSEKAQAAEAEIKLSGSLRQIAVVKRIAQEKGHLTNYLNSLSPHQFDILNTGEYYQKIRALMQELVHGDATNQLEKSLTETETFFMKVLQQPNEAEQYTPARFQQQAASIGGIRQSAAQFVVLGQEIQGMDHALKKPGVQEVMFQPEALLKRVADLLGIDSGSELFPLLGRWRERLEQLEKRITKITEQAEGVIAHLQASDNHAELVKLAHTLLLESLKTYIVEISQMNNALNAIWRYFDEVNALFYSTVRYVHSLAASLAHEGDEEAYDLALSLKAIAEKKD